MPSAGNNRFRRLKLMVNGAWVNSKSEDLHKAFNPATGAQIAEVPFCTPEEVSSAVESAHTAFESWRNVPIIDRVKFLSRLKDALQRHAEELAVANTENHGKTLEESRGDVTRAIENVDTAIAAAYTLSKGETLGNAAQGVDMQLDKEPLGVFAIVCPFNFPLMIPFWFIPYAVVLGDTVVVKPSEVTPVPMSLAAEIMMKDVKLPPGVFTMIHGGREVVSNLIANNLTAGVTFVGSTPVAREVYRKAGEHGKRAIVNGGAKNSVVVMADADLGRFMPNIVSSFFGNAGQRCLAGANLVTVGPSHRKTLLSFSTASAGLKVGNGLEPGVDMGPLVSTAAKDRVGRYIEQAAGEGAKVISDGRGLKVPGYPGGFYLGPSVLDGVDYSQKVAKEEIFGPVASVIQAETLEGAIDSINKSTSFGNMACIYTSSGRSAREFRRGVNAGNVGINIGVAAPPAYFPFGGRRDSFYGVLHAQVDTVSFFTDSKVTIERW